jgi:uncharacterized protein (DUF1778 family)
VSGRRPPGSRDRTHQRPGRPRQVMLRLSEEEFAELVEAAAGAGLTTSGYAAEAALAAAQGVRTPEGRLWRTALSEVMAAREQVRRFGVNVNQAVRVLNSTGEAPAWLEQAVVSAERTVLSLDQVASELVPTRARRS